MLLQFLSKLLNSFFDVHIIKSLVLDIGDFQLIIAEFQLIFI